MDFLSWITETTITLLLRKNKENSSQPKTNKRALSDNDTEKEICQNKKQKHQPVQKPVLCQAPLSQNDKVKTLTSFSQFMLSKKFKGKLTRSDLEQFCIQKSCEVAMNKSNEGEMYQTITKHEQTIEALRKDMQQLSKQIKGLKIVHKKSMNKLRMPGGTKNPLVPLKITRSVRLQVRLNVGGDNQRKRPQQQQQQAGTVSTPLQQLQQQVNNTSFSFI